MKNFLMVFALIMLLFVGCNTPNKYSPTQICNDSMHMDTAIKTNEDTCAFCQILLQEIKSFINKHEDYGPIIILQAEKKGGECCLFISTAYFYDSRCLIGYQIVEKKMVAYYYSFPKETMNYCEFITLYDVTKNDELLTENDCMVGLIDKSKLIRNNPTSFLNEKSENVMCYNYDPVGRRYVIHNSDSLELVFEGYY